MLLIVAGVPRLWRVAAGSSSTSRSCPATLHAAVGCSATERIRALTKLVPGWDGPGSIAPTRNAVRAAIRVAGEIGESNLGRVAAEADGSVVLFALGSSARTYRAVAAEPDGTLIALWSDGTSAGTGVRAFAGEDEFTEAGEFLADLPD